MLAVIFSRVIMFSIIAVIMSVEDARIVDGSRSGNPLSLELWLDLECYWNMYPCLSDRGTGSSLLEMQVFSSKRSPLGRIMWGSRGTLYNPTAPHVKLVRFRYQKRGAKSDSLAQYPLKYDHPWLGFVRTGLYVQCTGCIFKAAHIPGKLIPHIWKRRQGAGGHQDSDDCDSPWQSHTAHRDRMYCRMIFLPQ